MVVHRSDGDNAGLVVNGKDDIERALAAPAAVESPGDRSLARAVSEIAQTVSRPASNDAAWATQLPAETEDIANSITDASSKARALSGVAQALAATFPWASN